MRKTKTTTFQRSISLTLLVTLICTLLFLSTAVDAKSKVKKPIVLDEETWTQLLQGEWMVDFFAPWCPACKRLEPEWRKFSEWADDLNINIASADVTSNPGLSGRFSVSGLPTIYHVKDGIFRIYSGPREHTALINFVEEQGWKAVEPVSRWLAPDTLQMSFVAYSFRISMTLRDVHNYLVEDVGLPYYVSYLIFALCTVTLGTVLGLLIVFIIDQFCPSRYASVAHDTTPLVAKRKKSDKTKESDLDDSEETSEQQKHGQSGQSAGGSSDNIRRRGVVS